MPQIKKSLRPPLDAGKAIPVEVGDICYLITSKIIIPAWNAAPRWSTASQLHSDLVLQPNLTQLRSLFRGVPFSEATIVNQAAMAYHEFYRRCVANYEDFKARKNTDVYAGVPFSKSAQLTKGE